VKIEQLKIIFTTPVLQKKETGFLLPLG